MSKDLFAPPTEEELSSAKGVFAPPLPHEMESFTASKSPPYREISEQEAPYGQKFDNAYDAPLNEFNNKKGMPNQLSEQGNVWSKLKDYAVTSGMGFTEGATANKAAEIMSRTLPIKTNTKQVQGIFDEHRKRNPWTYGLSEAAGITVSPLTELGLPAFAALSGAEGDTWGEKGVGGVVGGAIGTGMSALTKKALPYLASKVPALTEMAGKAMQAPTDLATAMAEPIGAFANKLPFISKYLDSAGKSKTGTALFSDSAKVKALQSIEDVANLSEMGSKTANAVKSAEREIVEKLNSDQSIGGKLTNSISDFLGNDSLNKTYGSLSDPEKAVVMASMANGFKQRGLSIDPVALKTTFEDMAKNSGIDLSDSSIKDVVRTLNRRDPAWAVNSFKSVSDFFGPLLERTGNVSPEYYDAQFNVEKLHGMLKKNAINRMMQVNETNVGRGQIPLNELGNYAYDASHMTPTSGGPTMAGDKQFGSQIYQSSTNESTKILGAPSSQNQASANAQQQTKQQAQQIKMTKPWLGDVTEDSIKRYTGKSITDQTSLQEAGAIASGRLRNIYSGQAASNLVAGAASGGSAFMQHGFPGISSFMGYAPQAMSWAGKAGQALEQKGATMTPDNFASSMLTNPSVLAQLSKSSGKIGELARDLSQGMQSMGIEGVKSRLFVAMSNPSTRQAVMELMGNNQAVQPGSTVNLNQ